MMIKVLHVINGADLGGISSMLLNYYNHIDRDKVHFDFVTSFENGHNGFELEKLGAKFYFIQMKSKGLLHHVCELDKLMKTEHFDAIHVHSNHTSYVALMVAWKNHIKVRFAHGHTAVKSKLSAKAAISRFVGIVLMKLFATKRVACCSDAAVYTFGEHSLKESSMVVLPNSINIEEFRFNSIKRQKYREMFNISENIFLVGTVGRMSPEKNHRFLIGVFAELLKINPDSMLFLVGDGSERKELERIASDLGISSNIIFAGARSDVSDLLNALDAFVVPSFFEGFPIAALEALSNGLPAVLSDSLTKDFNFTDYASYIPLNAGKDVWAKLILEQKQKEHNSLQADVVKKAGYDISDSAKRLEALYEG